MSKYKRVVKVGVTEFHFADPNWHIFMDGPDDLIGGLDNRLDFWRGKSTHKVLLRETIFDIADFIRQQLSEAPHE